MHLEPICKVAAAGSIIYGHRDHYSSLIAWADDLSMMHLLGYYLNSNLYVRYYVPLPYYLLRAADRLMGDTIRTT